MNEALPPGRIYQREPGGQFGFLITDFSRTFPVTDEVPGLQGGGHTWSALAEQIAASEAPDLFDRIELDCEADMFAAYCNAAEPLQHLAGLLEPYFAEPDRLQALLDALGDPALD